MRDKLAALAHDQWSHWTRYFFSQGRQNVDGSITIPKELVLRWERQMGTPFEDLLEKEKISDRAWADKYMACLLTQKQEEK